MSIAETAERVRRMLATEMDRMEAEGLPVERLERDRAAKHPGVIGFLVDEYDLMSATVRRTPHYSEADVQACHLDLYRDGAADCRIKLRGFMDNVAALLRQDGTMAALGEDPADAPVKYHRIHPLTAAAARGAGWTPEQVVSTAKATTSGTWHKPLIIVDTGRRSTLELRTHRRVIHAKCFTSDLPNIRGGPTEEFSFRADEEQNILHIAGYVLPETVLASIPGRPLGDVFAHPLLAGAAGLIVQSATNVRMTAGPRLVLMFAAETIAMTEDWT